MRSPVVVFSARYTRPIPPGGSNFRMRCLPNSRGCIPGGRLLLSHRDDNVSPEKFLRRMSRREEQRLSSPDGIAHQCWAGLARYNNGRMAFGGQQVAADPRTDTIAGNDNC